MLSSYSINMKKTEDDKDSNDKNDDQKDSNKKKPKPAGNNNGLVNVKKGKDKNEEKDDE